MTPKAAALQHLKARAARTAGLADAAKQQVRAAKAQLKQARKLFKMEKKAAKQAKKELVAARASVRADAAPRSPKAAVAKPARLTTPSRPASPPKKTPVRRKAQGAPRHLPESDAPQESLRSAAEVAKSVIERLHSPPPVLPPPPVVPTVPDAVAPGGVPPSEHS